MSTSENQSFDDFVHEKQFELIPVFGDEESEELEKELYQSVVLEVVNGQNIVDVVKKLRKYCPPNSHWIMNPVSKTMFQVVIPNPFCISVLDQGIQALGLRELSTEERNQLLDPVASVKRVWISLTGVPYGLRTSRGVQKLTQFGDVVMINTGYGPSNYNILLALVEVVSVKMIPRARGFRYLRTNGYETLHLVTYTVIHDEVQSEQPSPRKSDYTNQKEICRATRWEE